MEIDLGDSELEYTPGDSLGIHASNAPEVKPYFTYTYVLGNEAMFILLIIIQSWDHGVTGNEGGRYASKSL